MCFVNKLNFIFFILELKHFIIRGFQTLNSDWQKYGHVTSFEFQVYTPYLQAVIDQLETQFPDNTILEALTVMDPGKVEYPDEPAYMAAYGNDQMPVSYKPDKKRISRNHAIHIMCDLIP